MKFYIILVSSFIALSLNAQRLSAGVTGQRTFHASDFSGNWMNCNVGYTTKHFMFNTMFTHSLAPISKEKTLSELGFGIRFYFRKTDKKLNAFAEGSVFYPVFENPKNSFSREYVDHTYPYDSYVSINCKRMLPRYYGQVGLSYKISNFELNATVGCGMHELIMEKTTYYNSSTPTSDGVKREYVDGEVFGILGLGVIYHLDLQKKERKAE